MEIYALRDPLTFQIRYIGKANSATMRFRQHINDKGTNAQKVQWIDELRRDGLSPELVILETVDECNWQEREREWIEYGREIGWPLLNITPGGGGVRWGVNWDDCIRWFYPSDIPAELDKPPLAYSLVTFAFEKMLADLPDQKGSAPDWLHDVTKSLITGFLDFVNGFSGKDLVLENKVIETALMSILSNKDTRSGKRIYDSVRGHAASLISPHLCDA